MPWSNVTSFIFLEQKRKTCLLEARVQNSEAKVMKAQSKVHYNSSDTDMHCASNTALIFDRLASET